MPPDNATALARFNFRPPKTGWLPVGVPAGLKIAAPPAIYRQAVLGRALAPEGGAGSLQAITVAEHGRRGGQSADWHRTTSGGGGRTDRQD
jgi:hypothetical protein